MNRENTLSAQEYQALLTWCTYRLDQFKAYDWADKLISLFGTDAVRSEVLSEWEEILREQKEELAQ